MARAWTAEQREAKHKKARSANMKVAKDGRRYYGLIFHLNGSTQWERRLAYEACYLNGATLEEWIVRHRIEGVLRGFELYLPKRARIISLDGDRLNVEPKNLLCFKCQSDCSRWLMSNKRFGTAPPQTVEAIREFSLQYTRQRKRVLLGRHPGTSVILRATHTVKLFFPTCTYHKGSAEIEMKCALLGQTANFGGVKHIFVRLETEQDLFVFESLVKPIEE